MTTANTSVRHGFADLPEGQVHYRTAGNGQPLLLLHPNTYSSELFSSVIPLFAAAGYRVVAPDRLGHGWSDPIPDHFNFIKDFDEPLPRDPTAPYEEFVTILVQLIDALGIQRAKIVGQHTGAHLAIELGVLHPQWVERLVLFSITDFADEQERHEFGRGGVPIDHRPKMDGSHVAEAWKSKAEWASPATTPEMLDALVMAALQARRPWPTLGSQVIRYYHPSSRLPHLRVPSLIVHPEHDRAAKYTDQQSKLLPPEAGVEVREVSDVGSFFALERPAEFVRVATEFLDRP